MLNRILEFSLQNRILVLTSTILLVVSGVFIASDMEVDVFPDLTAPTVVVMTEAHGFAPEEVERLVTFQIETAVNGATNVRRVRSSSTTGFSVVWVEFDWGTNIYTARQIVSEKLIALSGQLPEGVGTPTLGPQSSLMGEVLLVSLTSDSLAPIDLRTIADWSIRPQLLAVGGVSQVVVIGGESKQYQILLDPLKMKFYDVSLNEVMAAARMSNRNANGGILNQYGNEYIIRGIGRTNNLKEIGQTVIKVMNGFPIKIEDLATIETGPAPKIGDGSERAHPAVILTVTKQPNTNTIDLIAELDKQIASIKENLPHGIHVSTDIFRQSTFIESAINNVLKALVEGSFFVILVLFLFLMSARTTLISLIAIPVSLLVSILSLKLLGFSINTMSLGGMAIAIGALVDDAIIDVENVFKRLKENHQLPVEQQKKKLSVILDASKEIRASIINATFIIVITFVPLFFLSGMEGKLLAPLGISYIVSLIASLIVAITVTPVMCSYFLGSDKVLQKLKGTSPIVSWLNEQYQKLLTRSLMHSKSIITAAGILFVFALLLLLGFGRSFLPDFNEGSLVITTTSTPGISLEESDRLGQLAEKALAAIPEIKTTARKTGRAELDEHALGVNTSEIEAPYELKERSKEEFYAEIREKLSQIAGINFIIGQPISHRIDHMLSGTRANIAIKLFGTNLSTMFQKANEIKNTIKEIPGLTDLNVEQQIEIPQLQIIPRREMLARYCISIEEFTEFIDVALAGEEVGEVYDENKSFPLVVRFNNENRKSIETIRNILIDAHNGDGKVPLYFVAEVKSTSGPNTINRENVHRKLVISANVSGRDLRGVVHDIQSEVKKNIILPTDYRIEYGGQFESEEEASRILLIATVFSILMMFLILFQEFKNISLAFIILVNLPLAVIGGVFTIWADTGILSIPAIIGFITLLGIATRNGILLISRYQRLAGHEKDLSKLIIHGSVDRLSPILMTALTAALALLPMVLQSGEAGNEIQGPMAKVILGGLITSTILNIFVLPSIYYLKNRKLYSKTSDS